MARIPLLVLGGFLGAGKTTLLNHLLTREGGQRLAVLVNDFGPINVDAALIAAHDGETLSLTNGCICCSIGSGLEAALMRVLERTPPPDLVIIEASGVSDPKPIAQVGLVDPLLQLEAVAVLVDATRILNQLNDPRLADTLIRQIDSASLLVLNKADLLDEAALTAVREQLQSRFGPLPLLSTRFGQVPLDGLMAQGRVAPQGTLSEAGTHAGAPDAPDHPFESGLWSAPGVLGADELAAALKRLPRTVMRAKGWVITDRHGATLVHLAGGRVRFETVPAGRAVHTSELVYIGLRGQGMQAAVQAILDGARKDRGRLAAPTSAGT